MAKRQDRSDKPERMSGGEKAHIKAILDQYETPTLQSITQELKVFYELCIRSPLGPDSAPVDTLDNFGDKYVTAIENTPVPPKTRKSDYKLQLLSKYITGVCYLRTERGMERYARQKLFKKVRSQTFGVAADLIATHFGNIQRRLGCSEAVVDFWYDCARRAANPADHVTIVPSYYAHFNDLAGRIAKTDLFSDQERDAALESVGADALRMAGEVKDPVGLKVAASLWASAIGGLTDRVRQRELADDLFKRRPKNDPFHARAELLLLKIKPKATRNKKDTTKSVRSMPRGLAPAPGESAAASSF